MEIVFLPDKPTTFGVFDNDAKRPKGRLGATCRFAASGFFGEYLPTKQHLRFGRCRTAGRLPVNRFEAPPLTKALSGTSGRVTLLLW